MLKVHKKRTSVLCVLWNRKKSKNLSHLMLTFSEKAEKRENTLTVIPNHGRLYQCAAQRGYK